MVKYILKFEHILGLNETMINDTFYIFTSV